MSNMTGYPQTARQTALSHHDYGRFNRLLLERCGMHFSKSRQLELTLGVKQAFAASTCANLDDYYHLLLDPQAGTMEMDRLINAVTVGETHFFRNQPQFEALYDYVLPEIIARRQPLRALRIWSAGCSSGEEAYSIAILLRELLPAVDTWSLTILGTDINNEALARARRAQYGNWAFREPQSRLRRGRYFTRDDKTYRLEPAVRSMVTFSRLNLVDDVYPSYSTNTTSMDLILCRNVTIYFSDRVTHRIINRFFDALTPGGWLVVGHAEPSLSIYHRYETRNFTDTVLYQRPECHSFGASANGAFFKPFASADPLSTIIPLGLNKQRKTKKASAHSTTPAASTAKTAPLEAETDADILAYAGQLLRNGRSEEARDRLMTLNKTKLNEATVCTLLGQTYANMGDWSDAEHWCQRSIALDKLTPAAYYTLALVYQHQNRLDEAIQTMKKVVYLDREHILGHFGLAGLYRDNQQWTQAQKSLANTRHLLTGMAESLVIPDSGGITVGDLRETVRRQQQS